MPYTPDVNMSESTVTDLIHFFFLLDNSGSMSGSAIQTLNAAMYDVLKEVSKAAVSLELTPIMHILSFNSSINWLLGTQPSRGIEAGNLTWRDIGASGGTNTAGAIRELIGSKALSRDHLGHRAYRPIIILITDGQSNDRAETKKAINELVARQKSLRIAIGVQGYTPDELEAFASDATVKHEDDLGNITDSNKQKLIFKVDENIDFGGLVKNLTISSLISSKMMNATDMTETDTSPAKREEEPETVLVLPGEEPADTWVD